MKYKDELLKALVMEIEMRKEYLQNEVIQTVYFGGGTPSLLTGSEINRIYEAIAINFKVDKNIEFTFEANPDDLSKEKIREFQDTPINRLSIGIQSFYDEDLLWMNRSHDAKQAEACVKRAQDAGYENLNIDLIYGYPMLSMEKWRKNIQLFLDLEIPHLSSYSLTVEEKTALFYQIQNGKSPKLIEGEANKHFLTLREILADNNFIAYEISNYCKENYESKHNANYWKNKKYLGLGPSAHSFDLNSRHWNISNNALYMDGILKGQMNFEKEILKEKDRINEQILTGLRTIWGFNMEQIPEEYMESFQVILEEYMEKGSIEKEGNRIRLTLQGYLMADKISSDLFI